MTASLVLAFIGPDRPGLVKTLSETITEAGGSWLESRLAHLAGEFAGIVLVSVPAQNEADLVAALRNLEAAGLRITVETSRAAPAATGYGSFELHLIGHDRPGIVRDVTQALSQLGVNIEEFSSAIESAPFTGEVMFRAAARLHVPDGISIEAVQAALERLADEIMVDLTASAGESA
ncbi:MAG TPA: ACT domain-containing protein [Acidocella sp.]|jgi:glycine cleavage system regulatory protein|uniref:glycine cleavage system protein R n=1 Tax=Acidocella sp. TaxID=50710 RepID=UPI002C368934|nr:ACT domain-containing protein [Acidocella sp.]HVE23142.1 ACT domain-containing protein [Acidocella sp.]